MGVPYVIVKGKARLGTVVHKKTAAVLTVQDVKSEDQRELATIVSAAKANLYVLSCMVLAPSLTVFFSSDKYEDQRRQWGGGLRGNKSASKMKKRAKASGQSVAASTLQKL
jgi:large subunit ribosomal protein L7Ae